MKEWTVLQDENLNDEKGVFNFLIHYREYYIKKTCNCHPETCCCEYGWIREELKREKKYKMTLREQFEKEISDKYHGNTMMILFEQRLENYVKWLEDKLNNL